VRVKTGNGDPIDDGILMIDKDEFVVQISIPDKYDQFKIVHKIEYMDVADYV